MNIEKAIHVSNDFSILDNITHNLEQSTDEYYVALLPETLQDNYGQILKAGRLQDVFRLDWHFIVDLNKKNIRWSLRANSIIQEIIYTHNY